MIITGFTTSFLTPALLCKAGLRIVRASLPSDAAGGLENDTGRFQFFVLQKRKASERAEAEEGGSSATTTSTAEERLAPLVCFAGGGCLGA